MRKEIGYGDFVIVVSILLMREHIGRRCKMYKKLISLGILGLIFFSIGYTEEPGLKVRISLDKTYLVGENIWLTIWMENTGTKPETVCYDPYNNITIKNSKGEIIVEGTVMCVEYAFPWKILHPQDVYPKWTFNLLSQHVPFKQDIYIKGELPPDTYTIYSTQYLGLNPRKKTWRKRWISNVVKFRVIEPKGKEKEVYELLIKGMEEMAKGLKMRGEAKKTESPKYYERAKDLFSQIINLYPQSTYIPTVYWELESVVEICLGDYEKGIEIRKELIEKYPDSWEAYMAVGSIASYLETRKRIGEIKPLMEELIKKYPGTKVAERAKRVIWNYEEGDALLRINPEKWKKVREKRIKEKGW
jgi:outer membrane protein assembly factor BamD (BamD/ComL family)